MTRAEAEILEILLAASQRVPWRWLRPMDFGGSTSTHHAGTAKRMVAKRWAVREPRGGAWPGTGSSGPACRSAYGYRITAAGAQALSNHNLLKAAADDR